ncbi:MAG: helix-turn-helix transcriptional regulator [Sphaerospermopsis sp. SIO1G2]|nr:helix-turn-helix transcriptional regulator [Sphaerospermopsis sp. SIO1G2]
MVDQFLTLIAQRACRGITIAACAKACGVDRTTLFRRVSAITGRNPQDHLHDVRISHACTLLRTTDHTLATIAKLSGYGSSQRFCDAFLKRYPVAPGTWRAG